MLIFFLYPWYSAHPNPGNMTMRTDNTPLPRLPRPAPSRQSDPSIIAPTIANCLIKSLGADEALRCARRHHWDGVLTVVLAESGHAGVCR